MKLTFKNEVPTGRYRSFEHASCTIKADGAGVGNIGYSTNKNGYRIMLHVPIPSTDRGKFKNVFLKKTFEGGRAESLNAAKAWVKDNWTQIIARWPLHKLT